MQSDPQPQHATDCDQFLLALLQHKEGHVTKYLVVVNKDKDKVCVRVCMGEAYFSCIYDVGLFVALRKSVKQS